MTVGALREQMSGDEFGRWAIYYARQAQQRELAAMAGPKR